MTHVPKLLTPTNESGLIIARDADGMGWCLVVASAGMTLPCTGCGNRIITGYMPRTGGEYRCKDCVRLSNRTEGSDRG